MRSNAQKAADKKYRAKKLSDGTKKQINATLDIADYEMIDTHAKKMNISKAALIVKSIRYIISHDVDLSDQ